MSEELIQRGLTKNGQLVGPYEFYSIGSTTISALKRYKIVPAKDYAGYGSKKPDGLLVDRRDRKNVSVILVLENKSVEEFNTPQKKQEAIEQCVHEYCKPLEARMGVVTDGSEYIWVNPQCDGDGYEIILREDGYPLEEPVVFSSDADTARTLSTVQRVLTDISPANWRLRKAELQNPANLADRVWQTIWLASGENPDTCLATFVEIFLFKYLSDLGVLTQNDAGVKISFDDVSAVNPDRCLVFYFQNVRPHIKQIFPPSVTDGTSVINGIVLDPAVEEHNYLLHKILQEFRDFGPLTSIDPEFKSRLYENFLKKSISQKNWGQFFTPRNIVKAMIEMSDIELLGDGSKVHDPACGVGGFILEPILTKRPRDYYMHGNILACRLEYSGNDRDVKTVILAKANMLIHLNELMRANPGCPGSFAKVFNSTFKSLHTSILGSLGETLTNEYDLIMTNPPFVMTGTSKIKEFIAGNGSLRQYYAVSGAGVEGLFVEQIIRSLKPGGKALVIVPDGILNRVVDKKLRQFVLNECLLEAVISLPRNAFYTTPKKTYILVLTKKPTKPYTQTDPVFTYLVTNTGETLDASRFECENDLPEMVRLFKYFRADKQQFASPTKKCKVWDISLFRPDTHWSVDRWWTEDERVELGIVEEKNLTTVAEFAIRLEEEKEELARAVSTLKEMDATAPEPDSTVEVSLGDEQYFELFIGKRVLKRDLYYAGHGGDIPVYSANVKQPFGKLTESNISNFDNDVVLWGIDGNFEFNVIRRGVPFATTDHCGGIRILDSGVHPDYLYYFLNWIRESETLDRELRANLSNMRKVTIKFPVLTTPDGRPLMKKGNKADRDGNFPDIYALDLEGQERIAAFYRTFEQVKAEITERMGHIASMDIPPLP